MLESFESAKVAMILLAESAKITPAFVNGGKAEFPPFSLVGKFILNLRIHCWYSDLVAV